MNEQQETREINIKLNWYQDKFLFSKERYSCLIGGVGTGKTFVFLLKAWQICQENPGSLGLIVRREYTDLRDSTINDFEKYFGVKVKEQAKEYEFPNGSKIMFRHGDLTDKNVLKNINLTFFGIEQAEEYETSIIFDFLRDRLRQSENSCGFLIANAAGHNWIYERFIEGLREGHPEGWLHGVRYADFWHHRSWFIHRTLGAVEYDPDMGMQIINFQTYRNNGIYRKSKTDFAAALWS